jgi:hypothetical protein
MKRLNMFKRRGCGLLGCLALLAVVTSSASLAQEQPPPPPSPAPEPSPALPPPGDTPARPATQKWGPFKTDECKAPGLVQKSSILEGIPAGASWEEACQHMGADIDGNWYPHPTRCVNTRVAMWGEFDVPAEGCKTSWALARKGGCIGVGVRRYSARLDNVKDKINWDDACMNTPARINEVNYAQPTHCRHTGSQTWGEWDVPDKSCGPLP